MTLRIKLDDRMHRQVDSPRQMEENLYSADIGIRITQ